MKQKEQNILITTYEQAKKEIKNETISTHSKKASYIFINGFRYDLPFIFKKGE